MRMYSVPAIYKAMPHIAAVFLSALMVSTVHAEPDLYETGPAQDASFIRFVNATDQALTIATAKSTQAANAKIALTTETQARASMFYPVKSGVKLSATIMVAGSKSALMADVQTKPSEYVTVVVVPTVAAKGAKNAGATYAVQTIKETPEEFSAVRASIGLFNVNAQCAAAELVATPKNTPIVTQVKPQTVQRRLLNPINVSVQAVCANAASAPSAILSLGQLQAGERYSVFVTTDTTAAPLVFSVRDTQK
jgi:alginate O-acetyltransferase complex protein AlgF